MSHYHHSVFVSLIVASLLLPAGAYADDDAAAQPMPLPPDCINIAAFGYVDMLGPILPGKGPEAMGQATFNFGGVSVMNAAVTVNILTIPKFASDGSFTLRARFDDTFAPDKKWTMIYDAKFIPTTTYGVYVAKAKGTFAGTEGGAWSDMYYGASKADLVFANNRVTMTQALAVFCGVVNP
jgi:hypothetical protein